MDTIINTQLTSHTREMRLQSPPGGAVQQLLPSERFMHAEPVLCPGIMPGKLSVRFPKSHGAAPPAPADTAETKELTILLYMDGANDLEPYTVNNFLDLESVGSDKNLNVVAELSRISQEKLKEIKEKMGAPCVEPTGVDGDWSGVRRYYVMRDKPGDVEALKQLNSPVLEDLGTINMSETGTLADFLSWGVKKYPAKKYMVVLMDHGAGWCGAMTNDATAGAVTMSNPQIAAAFAKTEQETGVTFDVIFMKACLMANTESAYELKNAGKYLVGSEEIAGEAPGEFAPYIDKIRQDLADGKEVTGETLAKGIVEYYTDKASFSTISAIDLDKMEGVKNALGDFAAKLRTTDTGKDALAECIENALHFGQTGYEFYSHNRDLYSVAEHILQSDKVKDESLKESAKGMMEAIKRAVISKGFNNNMWVFKDNDLQQTDFSDSNGLSVYLPTNPTYVDGYVKGEEYKELATSKETVWDEFIVEKFGSPPHGNSREEKPAGIPSPTPQASGV